MPRKMAPVTPPAAPASPASTPRQECSLAFIRPVDELRPAMGRKSLVTIVAALWPKHQADQPEKVAVCGGQPSAKTSRAAPTGPATAGCQTRRATRGGR